MFNIFLIKISELFLCTPNTNSSNSDRNIKSPKSLITIFLKMKTRYFGSPINGSLSKDNVEIIDNRIFRALLLSTNSWYRDPRKRHRWAACCSLAPFYRFRLKRKHELPDEFIVRHAHCRLFSLICRFVALPVTQIFASKSHFLPSFFFPTLSSHFAAHICRESMNVSASSNTNVDVITAAVYW